MNWNLCGWGEYGSIESSLRTASFLNEVKICVPDGHLVAVIGHNRQILEHACVVTETVDGNSNLSHFQRLCAELFVTIAVNLLHDTERFQLTANFDRPLSARESTRGTLWIDAVVDDPENVTVLCEYYKFLLFETVMITVV